MRAERHAIRRWARAFVTLALATAAVAAASPAEAFCRRTVLPGDDSVGDDACPAGAPLFHRSQCFPYRLFATEGPVPNVVVSDRLARALASWTTTNTLCFPGIRPVELAATNVDPSSALVAGRNIVGFPREWRHPADSDGGILGLTTMTFEVDNGAILAVHTELNPNVAWSSSDVPAPNTADVETVLFHEAGHMFGFAHSEAPDAVMFAAYELGTAKRTLSDDDRAAICAAYPTRAERSTATGLVPATGCELTPGTEASCADPDIRHGCSVGPSSTSSDDHTWGILSLLPVAFVIRWKTRKRAASSAQP